MATPEAARTATPQPRRRCPLRPLRRTHVQDTTTTSRPQHTPLTRRDTSRPATASSMQPLPRQRHPRPHRRESHVGDRHLTRLAAHPHPPPPRKIQHRRHLTAAGGQLFYLPNFSAFHGPGGVLVVSRGVSGLSGASVRAVADDERAPKKRLSVSEAAASGDHKSLLVAMRERIAKTVSDPDCPPRDLAALTRRLQDIAKEIESIDLRAKEEAAEDGATPDDDWDSEAI